MFEACSTELAGFALTRYEVSNFARPGCESIHNARYWQMGDYIGIGAGAHSKLTDAAAGTVVRTARHKLPLRYLERAGSDEVVTLKRTLDENDLTLEFMMNALRLPQGFSRDLFTERTGLPLQRIEPVMDEALAKGLLQVHNDRIIPTLRGRQFLNNLIELF